MPLDEGQLISRYAPLVRRQALAMMARLPASVELDDLLQAGMMGLLDAARRYRKQADAQFETYAMSRIRGAMIDELRSQDWLPRSVRSKARSIEKAIQVLQHRLLRAPGESEIAAELGLDLEEYQALLEDAHGVQVLMAEDIVRYRDSPERESFFDSSAHDELSPLDQLVQAGLRTALVRAIKELPEREQLLLSLQFEQDLNQKEIAAVMQVSEGRVSQLRSQAVARIRAWLENNSWEPEAGDEHEGLL